MSAGPQFEDFKQLTPISWEYGSFAPASKMQHQFIKRLIQASHQKPADDVQKSKARPSSISKSVADDEYFRVAAQYKVNHSLERKIERKQNLIETFKSLQGDI